MNQIENLCNDIYNDTFVTTEAKKSDDARAREYAELQAARKAKEKQEQAEKSANEKIKKELLRSISKSLILLNTGISSVLQVKKLIASNNTKDVEGVDTQYIKDCQNEIKTLEPVLKGNENKLKKFSTKVKSPNQITDSDADTIRGIIVASNEASSNAIKLKREADRKLKKTAKSSDDPSVKNKIKKLDKASNADNYWRNRRDLIEQNKVNNGGILGRIGAEVKADKTYRDNLKNILRESFDDEILSTMDHEYVEYLSEADSDHITSSIDYACNLLYELATDTYSHVNSSLESMYKENKISDEQYELLKESANTAYLTY